jgi:hypothetical protein
MRDADRCTSEQDQLVAGLDAVERIRERGVDLE